MAILVELELCLHHQTPSALLVSDDGEDERAVWVPKSLVTWEPTTGDAIQAKMPEWLARDRGLI
jgi:hypothetical protein